MKKIRLNKTKEFPSSTYSLKDHVTTKHPVWMDLTFKNETPQYINIYSNDTVRYSDWPASSSLYIEDIIELDTSRSDNKRTFKVRHNQMTNDGDYYFSATNEDVLWIQENTSFLGNAPIKISDESLKKASDKFWSPKHWFWIGLGAIAVSVSSSYLTYLLTGC